MFDKPSNQTTSPGHEPIETNVRPIWLTGAVIVGVVVSAFIIIAGLMIWFGAAASDTFVGPMTRTAANPKDLSPLQQLRARETKLLSTYVWVDRSAGVARIPIDRAMQLVAQQARPDQSPTTNSAAPASEESPAQVTPAGRPEESSAR